MDVILGACEMQTATGFGFGSRESGCWRFGRIKGNDVSVGFAVAASAAYPGFLPALDQSFTFETRDGGSARSRVIITDGGVVDNLGVSYFDHSRSAVFSDNVFKPHYVVACSASPGEFGGEHRPYHWPTRNQRAFEAVFKKGQDRQFAILHRDRESGHLRGFAMPFLGQDDAKLPYRPPDLVTREEVVNYPTNFAAMAQRDIEKISLRGEQLTRILLEYYLPNL